MVIRIRMNSAALGGNAAQKCSLGGAGKEPESEVIADFQLGTELHPLASQRVVGVVFSGIRQFGRAGAPHLETAVVLDERFDRCFGVVAVIGGRCTRTLDVVV